MSEVWGVIWDRDRSAESPVQMFTPRNSRGLTITKGFARLPDGLRVTFDDADRDWQPRQITVWRKGAPRDTGRTEQVRYEGVDTLAAANARAGYDLAVLTARACTYGLETPPECIVSRRGDLVAVAHDILSEQHGFGRVIAGGTDEIVLDAAVKLINEPTVDLVEDFSAVENVALLGLVSAAAIQRADGTVDVEPLDCETGETDVLIFANPTTKVLKDQLVAVGPLSTEV
ncbi:phage tail protein, partial [Cereibacter sphaeroides]|nr:phage tail protein [Cereibacter sphaeroides]